MKVLNLYAGIGGNRKLWSGVDCTAVEIDEKIARIYQKFFPYDRIVISDAHEYLLGHYDEYDFIWSSPPCQTHSRINNLNYIKKEQGQVPKYPDMRLYEEIVFLQHWFKGKWVVENVIGYYEPLLKPFRYKSHYFWSNFVIPNTKDVKRYIRAHLCDMKNVVDKDFMSIDIKNKEQIINNCVEPKIGKYIFDCAFKLVQKRVVEG
ncbi:DNA cytosine methyltransferase [Gammaproteobacteria bacterium]